MCGEDAGDCTDALVSCLTVVGPCCSFAPPQGMQCPFATYMYLLDSSLSPVHDMKTRFDVGLYPELSLGEALVLGNNHFSLFRSFAPILCPINTRCVIEP